MTSASLGPAPARAVEPLSAARARVASALAEAGPQATLATLAERLGGHPNATRQHLDGLVADGHATIAPVAGGGRGRPARGWTITALGRRALAGDAGDSAYAELVDAVADRLAGRPDAREEARAIGRAWGERRAQQGRTLTDVLAELGFAPAPDPTDPGTTRLLACPILDAARAHPEVICGIHAGLVEGALGTDGVRLVPFAEPGACLVRTGVGGRLG